MGIFGLLTRKEHDREIETLKAAIAENYPKWLLDTAGSEKFTLPDPSVYANQASLYQKLSWVLTAVDMTAQAGALTPFSVARIVSGKEPKDIPNHEFELLLKHPNELDSRFEFLYATIAFWKLNGNAYWWLNRSSENDKPEEMWVIPPHMIQPIPDDRMFLKGYRYFPGDGQELFLEPWEIVHFMRFNPYSRFTGMSAIESLALVANGDLGMQDWNTRLFKENNARLPGIIAFADFVAEPAWGDIKKNVNESAAKRQHMMLRGVGQGGVNWLQNAVSQKEMEFLEGRKANKEEIFSVLAPGLMSMLSENATEANSRTGRATFSELTVYPMHVMIAEKVSNEILSVYPGRPLTGHFEDIRVSDRALELQEIVEYSKTHTLAEIREEKYGDDPLGDDRDKLLLEQITATSGDIQKSEPPKTPPTPPQGAMPQDQAPQDANAQQQQQDAAARGADASTKARLDELVKMELKARRAKGKPFEFIPAVLDPHEVFGITQALRGAKDDAAIKAVFERARAELRPRVIANGVTDETARYMAEQINALVRLEQSKAGA